MEKTKSVDDSNSLDARHGRGHAMRHAAYMHSWKPLCSIGAAVLTINWRNIVVFNGFTLKNMARATVPLQSLVAVRY